MRQFCCVLSCSSIASLSTQCKSPFLIFTESDERLQSGWLVAAQSESTNISDNLSTCHLAVLSIDVINLQQLHFPAGHHRNPHRHKHAHKEYNTYNSRIQMKDTSEEAKKKCHIRDREREGWKTKEREILGQIFLIPLHIQKTWREKQGIGFSLGVNSTHIFIPNT